MQVSKITVDQVRELQRRNQLVQLIDVRESADFNDEHIPGSVNATLSDIAAQRYSLNPNQPIYLICRSGKKAEIAATLLTRSGHKNLFIVAGGILAWMVQGFPLHHPCA